MTRFSKPSKAGGANSTAARALTRARTKLMHTIDDLRIARDEGVLVQVEIDKLTEIERSILYLWAREVR